MSEPITRRGFLGAVAGAAVAGPAAARAAIEAGGPVAGVWSPATVHLYPRFECEALTRLFYKHVLSEQEFLDLIASLDADELESLAREYFVVREWRLM